MRWFSKNKKRRKEEMSDVPIFHGSDSVIRSDEFDYSKANPLSDFGVGAYFSFSFGNARDWTKRKDPQIVNSYIFHAEDARNDPDVVMEDFSDDLEWLNKIVRIYLGMEQPESIIIGKIMDGHTASTIQKYERIAERQGRNLFTMDDELKFQMIRELKVDRIGEQIVFRRKEDLRYVEYINSVEVSGMDYPRIMDPSEVAADVSILLSVRYGIRREDALGSFMKSNTFRRVLEDESMADMDVEEILETYLKEVS